MKFTEFKFTIDLLFSVPFFPIFRDEDRSTENHLGKNVSDLISSQELETFSRSLSVFTL